MTAVDTGEPDAGAGLEAVAGKVQKQNGVQNGVLAGAESDPPPAAAPLAPADPTAAAADLVALTAELAAAQVRADENHGLYLRALAEMENVRRRSQEETSKAHKFAIESFAEGLVPVVDSLEKALQDDSASPGALRAGVEITLRQLRSAFERGRLVEINPVAEKFDPHRHQSVASVPADGSIPPNHVAAVLQKGWMIADRVLRPALVTVAQST